MESESRLEDNIDSPEPSICLSVLYVLERGRGWSNAKVEDTRKEEQSGGQQMGARNRISKGAGGKQGGFKAGELDKFTAKKEGLGGKVRHNMK